MTTLVAFIVVLGVLVFIHELGHFIVAKRVGVCVERFSLGFGPKIFAFQRGGTEYCVSLIPLGGYVKMKGEEHEGEEGTGAPEEYRSRSLGERVRIVAAGPTMNLFLAFFLSPLPFWIGMEVPSYLLDPAEIGWIAPESVAAEAGLKPGDRIIEIDGKPVDRWKEVQTVWLSGSNRLVPLKVRRGEEILTVDLPVEESPDGTRTFGGIFPPLPPVVGEVNPGSPAEEGGIRVGDRIVSMEGVSMIHWHQLTQEIRSRGIEPIRLGIERGGELREIVLTPKWNEELQIPQIGIGVAQTTVFQRETFLSSVRLGIDRVGRLTGLTFVILGKLLTGELSIKALGGPVLIAQASGEAAKRGIADLIAFMAFLSLQLGILNLLPIPALDGGHLFFILIEAIRRKPLSLKARAVASQVGFFVLIGFILVVTYNDLMRVRGGIEEFFRRVADFFSHLL